MKVTRLVSRSLAASLLAVSILTVSLSGCGGFSTEDAQARCDQEEEARGQGSCFNQITYDGCVEAFEECGDDADVNEGCPLVYSCPE